MTAPRTPITESSQPPFQAPPGWSWVQLADVARLESGHTPSRTESDYWGGSVPWLSLKDIKSLDGDVVVDTKDHPTELGIQNSSARLLPENTVALCRTASVGRAVILGREMATSQDFVNWICGERLDHKYLLAALRASGPEFDRLKQGTTHKTIYFPTVKRFKILLPPLPEQRRIASILDKADAIRRKRREAIKLTEDLLRATFLDMFGDPVNNPRHWITKPLSSVAEIVSGVTKGRKLPPGHTVSVPYLRVANVLDGRIDTGDVKNIDVLPSDVEKTRLSPGDVLLTEGGDPDKLGRGAVWHGQIATCIHQNHVFRVRCRTDKVLPEYLSALIASDHGKRYFLRSAKQTTGIASINMTQLRAFPTRLPPLSLQRSFSDLEIRAEALRLALESSSNYISSLFDSLVHNSFRGTL